MKHLLLIALLAISFSASAQGRADSIRKSRMQATETTAPHRQQVFVAKPQVFADTLKLVISETVNDTTKRLTYVNTHGERFYTRTVSATDTLTKQEAEKLLVDDKVKFK